MRNVLIISYYFPPSNKIASRRFGQMVEYFNENDWNAWVLTTNSEGDLPVRIDEKQIVRISQTFTPSGLDSKKIGIGTKLRSSVTKMGFKPITIDRTNFKWVREVANNFENISNVLPEIDAVVSTFGPGAAFKLGLFFKRKYNVPLILDFRDLAALKNGRKNIFVRVIDRFVERKYIKQCNALTTISPTLGVLLKQNYKTRTEVIFNGWDKIVKNKTQSEEKFIYYAGRIYPHQIGSFQLLMNVYSKNSSLPDLRIRSISVQWINEKLQKIVAELNLNERVHILPPCSSEVAAIESLNAYVNLVLEDLEQTEIWPKGTLTGKFLQLISLSPPILSIARPDNDMGCILKETERGRLCSTTEEISDFFKDLNKNNDKYCLKLEKIKKYSKQEQARHLCTLLDEIIKQSER